MSQYSTLIRILDAIRNETKEKYLKKYAANEDDDERINQARSRAFVHLYLKVSFGLTDFEEREHYITDGSFDGGIDGYYIHKDSKTVYFIQSKYRTTKENFESKNIKLEEILIMDINRILDGEDHDENGNLYNGKIKQLQRDISDIPDIGRYKYHVVLLANLETSLSPSKMRYLTGGYPIDVFDYNKCYSRLVFPVLSGTFFNATDLNIYIDLSNKNAGSKISYTVQTKNGECEITVLFVPTIEIAKVLDKYKNSILKYNPRSYLELDGQKVNTAIRQTILNERTNEFALYNNGITMLSDETNLNERIGQKNKAQLTVKNPQIINGGQTAYTLSKIYTENLDSAASVFENKEVLLKLITVLNNGDTSQNIFKNKLELIDNISTATNQQTAVIPADRFSNDSYHTTLQNQLFNRYGVLYERKRGEFFDGMMDGYILEEEILERNLFLRIHYSTKGQINKASRKKLFQEHRTNDDLPNNFDALDKFYFGYCYLQAVKKPDRLINRKDKSLFAKIYVFAKNYQPGRLQDYKETVSNKLLEFEQVWHQFMDHLGELRAQYLTARIDRETQQINYEFDLSKWYRSEGFEQDVFNYFK